MMKKSSKNKFRNYLNLKLNSVSQIDMHYHNKLEKNLKEMSKHVAFLLSSALGFNKKGNMLRGND